MTIYKFGLNWATTELLMPKGANVLSVQVQNDRICIWAMVDPLAPKEVRTFTTYGTGHVMEKKPYQFIGTVQVASLVWHIFEEKS